MGLGGGASFSPVAVLGFLGHAGEGGVQAAQVIIQFAGVTQQKQVLILVLLADSTAAETWGDIMHH